MLWTPRVNFHTTVEHLHHTVKNPRPGKELRASYLTKILTLSVRDYLDSYNIFNPA